MSLTPSPGLSSVDPTFLQTPPPFGDFDDIPSTASPSAPSYLLQHSSLKLTEPFPRLSSDTWGDFYAHVVVDQDGMFRLRVRHRKTEETFLSAPVTQPVSPFQSDREFDAVLRGSIPRYRFRKIVKRKVDGVRSVVVRIEIGAVQKIFSLSCSQYPEPSDVILRRQVASLQRTVRQQSSELEDLRSELDRVVRQLLARRLITPTGGAEEETSDSDEDDDDIRVILFQTTGRFAYVAKDSNQLSFSEGQVIRVFETSDDGWWYGKTAPSANGVCSQGFFPGNFTNAWEKNS